MNKIGIFGVPRSGTSWLGQIFNSHPKVVFRFQPLFSYGHKSFLSANSSENEINSFFKDILYSQDAFATMTADTQKGYPIFPKSKTQEYIVFKETRYLHIIENLLNKSKKVKVIGIIRNPLSVLASWMSAPREFQHGWDIRAEWKEAPSKNQNSPEEFFGFNKWKESAEAFLRFQYQFPKQFFLVTYSDLNQNPLDTTIDMFNFCGLDICGQVEDFITRSKARHDSDPYSVFRAKANDERWRDILPDEIVEEIKSDLKDSPLNIFLYS